MVMRFIHNSDASVAMCEEIAGGRGTANRRDGALVSFTARLSSQPHLVQSGMHIMYE